VKFPEDNRLGRAALAYARRLGWSVLPLEAGGKAPCGRLVPIGVKDATAEPVRIREWWARAPDSNVGVAVGASGLVVVDVDQHPGGADGGASLAALEAEHGELPDTVEAITGGGGRHLVFAAPDGEALRAGPIAPGVDVKAGNSYITVAPSVHPSGREYAWDAAHHPLNTSVAPLPGWIADLVRTHKTLKTQGGPSALDSLLGRAFLNAGLFIRAIDHGRAAVRCPWEGEHSVGTVGDSSTVVFAPSEGSELGWFYCSHGHCAGRSLEDVLLRLPERAVRAARAWVGDRPVRRDERFEAAVLAGLV
jgi:hypothetical protein